MIQHLRWRGCLGQLLGVVLLVSSAMAEEPVALLPYRVRIPLEIFPDSSLPRAQWTDAVEQLQTRLSAHFGQMWELQVQVEAATRSDEQLRAYTEEQAAAEWRSRDVDKVFVLQIQAQGGDVYLRGREWDAATGSLSPCLETMVNDRRNLAAELAALVIRLFRPLVQIDVIEGETIEGLARAGEFPTPDEADALFAPGSLLVPYLRYLDKSRQVRKVQPILWTYLEVAVQDRGRLRLSLHSAFRAPLPASRRRVEVVALRVQPQWPRTEIAIMPRGQPENPLVGARCTLTPLADAAAGGEVPAAAPPGEPMYTDRDGILTLAAPASSSLSGQLQSLQVYSGTALLARVPVLPGAAPRLTLETPDDQARLHVEGEVQRLEGELIDLVATREVLITRTNAAMEQKRWSDVDRFLKELQRLPTQEQFVARITRMQLQAVQSARDAKDRVAETRIERLCQSIRSSAEKYLDNSRVRDFVLDVNSARIRQEAAQ